MATQIWHQVIRQHIDGVVDNPHVADLLRHWHQLRQDRARAPLALFHAERWRALHPRLMLLHREGDEFVYRHYGTEIARHSQGDMTGQRVSDFGGRLTDFFHASYRDALAHDQPLYTVHVSDRSLSVFTWERLILPLAAGDAPGEGGDWLLVYGHPLQMRHQLLESVLDATSDALLALRRVCDARGADLGWMGLVINPAFTEMFGLEVREVVGFLVRDVLAEWPALNIEAECLLTLQSRGHRAVTRVLLTSQHQLRYLDIQIRPLKDGVVISLTDATDLHEAQKRLRHLATTDALTGLGNRREFDDQLRLEVQRARRSGEPLALVMADIDAFKAYNDHWGHAAGDDCLRQFALILKSVFARELDVVARYGGEEFAVLLPGTGVEGALNLTERMLLRLRREALPHPASPVAPVVTASFGVATFQGTGDDGEVSLLRRADEALYQAKQAGRNQVCRAR
ncbi:sensor domain-containing diguanylate cyclase [Sphaerotilus sp.]|jgi:diguanylate cyclase (GGDEF)-like protein|uniref:sensor domain-containing diguanylate cyclase n=1 Tax=Sphaerotilus sp. TaxID=2093942 RepID=UPI0025D85060|nr:sensor domain-containing diguanylate cyclase [Sphaerotilus sp.]